MALTLHCRQGYVCLHHLLTVQPPGSQLPGLMSLLLCFLMLGLINRMFWYKIQKGVMMSTSPLAFLDRQKHVSPSRFSHPAALVSWPVGPRSDGGHPKGCVWGCSHPSHSSWDRTTGPGTPLRRAKGRPGVLRLLRGFIPKAGVRLSSGGQAGKYMRRASDGGCLTL